MSLNLTLNTAIQNQVNGSVELGLAAKQLSKHVISQLKL